MWFELDLTEEEYEELQALVFGPSAPTMDFGLSVEYVEGWNAGRSALCNLLAERLSKFTPPAIAGILYKTVEDDADT